MGIKRHAFGRGEKIFFRIYIQFWLPANFRFPALFPFFFFFLFSIFFFSTCSFDSNSPPQPIADKPVAIKTDPDA